MKNYKSDNKLLKKNGARKNYKYKNKTEKELVNIIQLNYRSVQSYQLRKTEKIGCNSEPI